MFCSFYSRVDDFHDASSGAHVGRCIGGRRLKERCFLRDEKNQLNPVVLQRGSSLTLRPSVRWIEDKDQHSAVEKLADFI